MSGIIIKLYMKIEEKVCFISNFPKRKRFTFHSVSYKAFLAASLFRKNQLHCLT